MAKPLVSLFLAVIAGYLLSVLSKLQVWEANLSVKLLFFSEAVYFSLSYYFKSLAKNRNNK